jgi:hypothetical protein
LLHGAYLRCHPNANAETLIKKFLAVYSPQVGDLLPTLDIEEDYDNRCSLPVQKRVKWGLRADLALFDTSSNYKQDSVC